MTLLALLARERLAGEGIEVVAAHLDHGTRGDDSAADGRFVEAVASRWGARTRRGRADVPARREARGEGPQAAAREARYAWLRTVARAERAAFVATAHHRDDRVETVILRIVRGTSVAGLGALRPVERLGELTVARPLLPFTRTSIADWAMAAGVPFREDPSNADPAAPRTIVRRRVVPLLEELNPRFDAAVVRLATRAAADDAWLESVTRERLESATELETPDLWSLASAKLIDQPEPILGRAVLALWEWGAPPDSRPPTAEWVAGAVRFLQGGRGGTVECPGGGTLGRAGGRIEARPPDSAANDLTDDAARRRSG